MPRWFGSTTCGSVPLPTCTGGIFFCMPLQAALADMCICDFTPPPCVVCGIVAEQVCTDGDGNNHSLQHLLHNRRHLCAQPQRGCVPVDHWLHKSRLCKRHRQQCDCPDERSQLHQFQAHRHRGRLLCQHWRRIIHGLHWSLQPGHFRHRTKGVLRRLRQPEQPHCLHVLQPRRRLWCEHLRSLCGAQLWRSADLAQQSS